ncbi:MAG: NAD(P)H-dependent oxidoreductase subunit E [Actinomycetota bacterium]|jgi:NADH-quinone oxidoreductase subunit E|nr:NADH-quinone oxidoreductase subunit NuoE [Acidimicrobiales bacterium]MEC7898863.1 NAD(P)H-dependent oxidoreductase subunit E [Actinomycetota bacterium]|tara:strand:+ start:2407 stop:3042 length:636 start_codon:yes stop_codon:yes gene_type:complete
MSFFTSENEEIAKEIVSRYPVSRSALIPLLHLAQEQEGWITKPAMEQIAELTNTTSVEVLGTGTFYEMFKFHPVGSYLVKVCTNISCQLLGADELLEHIKTVLDVEEGEITEDGLFTFEEAECVAACTEAPCFTVNYRYFHRATKELFDEVIVDLKAGESPLSKGAADDQGAMPKHGTLSRVRQQIPKSRCAGIKHPDESKSPPKWIKEGV